MQARAFPLAIAALLFVFSPRGGAFPVSEPKVQRLSERAEIIVKATVSQVTELGEGKNSLSSDPAARSLFFEAQLQPLYALKGTVPNAPIKVSFERGIDCLPVEYLVKGATYLVFLKASGGGYALADSVKSKIMADPTCPAVQPQGATTEDCLRAELLGEIQSRDAAVVADALAALGDLGFSRDDVALIAPFVNSPDKTLAGCALATLLKSGYFEYLDAAVAYMGTYPKTNSKEFGWASKIGVVVRKITDPGVAARLIGAMDSPNLLVRQSAAYVLRQAKVRAAVPLFVKGLQDADFDVRYHCLLGLAETIEGKLNGDWACTTEFFAKDENKYIRVWQEWWENEGKKQDWQ